MARFEAKVHYAAPGAAKVVAEAVRALFAQRSGPVRVLCIGSDRSTGDSLGPLVGTLLVEAGCPLAVFGTLDAPIHAVNLPDALPRLGREGLTVAIDAALGPSEHVGSIFVARGPLVPGSGVQKSLPAVGDVAVTATVNVGGFMEHLVLQNTRLSLVLGMARVIAAAILAVAADDQSSNVASSRATSSSGVIPSTLITGASTSVLSSPRKSSLWPLKITASTSVKSASSSGTTS
jgi:putative sporulation protein YyaC